MITVFSGSAKLNKLILELDLTFPNSHLGYVVIKKIDL